MRRLLFLAYHFPPVGGAGVQRSLHFARHLPAFGYAPVVVTGPGGSGRWTPVDESLARQVPDGLAVHRVPEPAQNGARSAWRRRGARWVGLPDPFSRWWIDGATAAGVEVGRGTDVILASMSPYESAFAAAQLSAKLGCPWVADLRDPWALDEMQAYPTLLHRRRAVDRMRWALMSASAIVMNTREAARALVDSFPELRRIPIVSIPNGFDSEDFSSKPPEPDHDSFRIVHTGYLHTELGYKQRRMAAARRLLGGEVARVDVLARSHLHLLEAIRRLGASDPSVLSSLELHLAGVTSDTDRRNANIDCVRWHGYVPHEESVGLLRSADLLFLPMQDLPAGRRARMVPGKTYEYLASGRPIIAAVPEGDARDLLTGSEGVWVCAPRDVDAMTRILREAIASRRRYGRTPDMYRPALNAYERRALTAQLADTLDDVVGGNIGATRPTVATKIWEDRLLLDR